MFSVIYSTRFKKDIKLAKKQRKNLNKLKIVISLLLQDKILSEQNRDHALTGRWNNYRECHIEPDWLLIYKKDNIAQTLSLVRLGSHSELFM